MSAIGRRLAKLEVAAQPTSPGLADALEAMRARNRDPEAHARMMAAHETRMADLVARADAGERLSESGATLVAMWRRRPAVARA